MEATLAGDRSAFDELVIRYQTRVFNLALRVTGNRDDALDATQSAFLNAFDRLASFDLGRKFYSWLCRIGVNAALDIVRGRDRFTGLDDAVPSHRAGPEEITSGHEAGERIQQALGELNPDYRVVVVLRHLHGLSYQEMSEVVGVPVKTIKSRLFTARRELRSSLRAKGLVR